MYCHLKCVCSIAVKPCRRTPFVVIGACNNTVMDRVVVDILQAGEIRVYKRDMRIEILEPDLAPGLSILDVEFFG